MRKRNSFSVSAPTGQMSTTLPAYLLLTGWPGLMSMTVVIAALENRQLRSLRHFVEEARASRAQDASLLIEHHARADVDRLALVIFLGQRKARRLLIVIHVVVLQLALAGLIANRTIDRMVDQQEFEHRLLRGLGLGAFGVNDHPFGDARVACDLQLRCFFDFDQAHPAVAGDRSSRDGSNSAESRCRRVRPPGSHSGWRQRQLPCRQW